MHVNALIGLLCATLRIWIWVMEPTSDIESYFNITRDNIYIAIILTGAGSSTMLVVSLSLVSYLIGKHTVSRWYQAPFRAGINS